MSTSLLVFRGQQGVFTTGAGFSNIPGKYENVIFNIKNLKTGIYVFKSNSQIIKSKKYQEIPTTYKCVAKLSMIIQVVISYRRNRQKYDQQRSKAIIFCRKPVPPLTFYATPFKELMISLFTLGALIFLKCGYKLYFVGLAQ